MRRRDSILTQKPDGQRKPHFLGWKTTDQEEIERRRLRALSVGLNSQAANVVINLDLPWNPARLEQRIARAWRKHQTRPVSVINLVSQRTIEHRMLGLLEHKQELADEVVDGRGRVRSIMLPSGRKAMIERIESLMAGDPAAAGQPATTRAGTPAAADSYLMATTALPSPLTVATKYKKPAPTLA